MIAYERYSSQIRQPRTVTPQFSPSPVNKVLLLPQLSKITQTPSFPLISGKRNLSMQPTKTKIETNPISNRPSECFKLSGLEDFIITRILGKGSYAIVRLAINKTSSEQFAIKSYDKTKISSTQSKKNLKTEIKILKFLDHPKIIKLYEIRETPLGAHLILEYFNGCSLEDYVKHRRKLEEYDVADIFKQILSAISYCHMLKIAHRDIKLGNILIDSHKQVKMIDFGFATHTLRRKKFSVNCGTPYYMAPEIVLKKTYDPLAADIWAMGVCLYVMLTGEEPFRGKNQKEVYRKIVMGVFTIPKNLSKGSKGLIKNLMQVDPGCRISASQALHDSWLNSYSKRQSDTKIGFDTNFLLSDTEEEVHNKQFGEYIRDNVFKENL
ncbi:unnamed protein product [Blepharisma stoltei]|uniref:Protein kinase domain-containing protein n=1 Tax=Blepharisma stoltei TaxID=1481888 RepID=A0AAU9J309_9CILI|nr:unnamed protein product [Blepharisma stoltei]